MLPTQMLASIPVILASDENSFIPFLSLLFGFVITLFWLAAAWRAMKAHERLADSHERLAEVARDLLRLQTNARPPADRAQPGIGGQNPANL